MNYVEFKMSLIKSAWNEDSMLFIEDLNNDAIFHHRHTLFVDEEFGLQSPSLNEFCLSWSEMEEFLEDGKWENYSDEKGTIMEVNGKRYRILFYLLSPLENLLS